MGTCRIQRPTGSKGIAHHGDAFVQITHNNIDGDVIKYEGEKGNLYIHLICDEENGVDINTIISTINTSTTDDYMADNPL
jgi:hypothetical protein